MRLLCMRHGAAASSGPYADADRPLTPEGVEEIERAGRALERLGLAPRVVLTSPAERCRHSATLIAEALGMKPDRIRIAATGPAHLLQALTALGAVEQVLVVGHEPDVAGLTSMLLSGSNSVQLHFRCSSVACLEVDGLPPSRPASLVWFLDPGALRLLGREGDAI